MHSTDEETTRVTSYDCWDTKCEVNGEYISCGPDENCYCLQFVMCFEEYGADGDCVVDEVTGKADCSFVIEPTEEISGSFSIVDFVIPGFGIGLGVLIVSSCYGWYKRNRLPPGGSNQYVATPNYDGIEMRLGEVFPSGEQCVNNTPLHPNPPPPRYPTAPVQSAASSDPPSSFQNVSSNPPPSFQNVSSYPESSSYTMESSAPPQEEHALVPQQPLLRGLRFRARSERVVRVTASPRVSCAFGARYGR
eukprot:sb/3468801/